MTIWAESDTKDAAKQVLAFFIFFWRTPKWQCAPKKRSAPFLLPLSVSRTLHRPP